MRFAQIADWLVIASAQLFSIFIIATFRTQAKICLGFFILFLSIPLNATNTDTLNFFLDKAESSKLASTADWRKLIFVVDRWFPSDKSLWDDSRYFLSPNGRSNPEAELNATIEAMFSQEKIKFGKKEMYPQCVFAARFYFLQRKLEETNHKFPRYSCPNFETFMKYTPYSKVSLVFSDYFMNSPASMFGHTLLRLHREDGKHSGGGLLDDVANFSAFVGNFNPILYPFQGLIGYFPGKFSLLPYYRKIQEYNNYESRDLWEYELNFSKEEVKRLKLVFWELGYFYLDYYYLDDNCSYILLASLEAAKPELQLARQFTLYATPADTLKAVVDSPGLVKKISYRPSSLARYLQRLKYLDKISINSVVKIIREKSIESLKTERLSNEQKVKILDTSLEYIDFKEKLSGQRTSKNFGKLRSEILLYRSTFSFPSVDIGKSQPSSKPHLGHRSAVLGVSSGVDEDMQGIYKLQWRPAHHDLTGNPMGYTNGMQIRFLQTQFNFHKDKAYLKELFPLELYSLPKNYPLLSPWAWHFNFGYKAYEDCSVGDICYKRFLTFGYGKSLYLLNDELILFVMPHLELGENNEKYFNSYAATNLRSGLIWNPNKTNKLNIFWNYDYWYARHKKDFHNYNIVYSYFLNSNSEWKFQSEFEGERWKHFFTYRHYY